MNVNYSVTALKRYHERSNKLDTELEKLCPYAPYTSVLTVIRHIRDRELKEPVTSQLITTINVSEGNASRTIAALRFLKLLDEEGYITPKFREIENAPNEEYPEVLGRILRDEYKHVFMALDPATGNEYLEFAEFLDRLSGERSPIALDRLKNIWNQDSDKLKLLIQRMVDAGILQEYLRSADTDVLRYSVAELYLYGLGMKRQGQR